MKTTALKSTFLIATFLFCFSACIKPPCKCDYTASGTIEQCKNDASVWFINSYSGGCWGTTQLFLPENLPAAYKVDGLTVSFEYNLLPESIPLTCLSPEISSPPSAQKIKLCKIEKDGNVVMVKKPNIYLYPTKETKIDVKLNYQGRLTTTYPDYDKNLQGWSVIAQKDGTLKNLADQREYQYLFWEGRPETASNFNMKEGFCVKGSETKNFLQSMLPKLGLIPKEYNEMIVFWLPQMMNNPYNLIHFATEDYTKTAPLTVTPQPDNMIRVFMAYQPSDVFVKTNEPFIKTPKRKGFTVVEWGGSEVPKVVEATRIDF